MITVLVPISQNINVPNLDFQLSEIATDRSTRSELVPKKRSTRRSLAQPSVALRGQLPFHLACELYVGTQICRGRNRQDSVSCGT